MVCNVHVHCINNNVGDKPLVVICNVDTKPQGIPCLFSSDNLPARRCMWLCPELIMCDTVSMIE